MSNLSSHACRGAFAGLAAAAMLLLAHAACAANARVSGTASTIAAPSRQTGLPVRRCDPPPCPRRAVTAVPKQGARP